MSDMTFTDLELKLMTLYKAGAYDQAYSLLEEEHQKFPEQANEVDYWRICMHAVVGKQEEALQLFRTALDKGQWFPPTWLTDDPDLASLQPSPAFQAMVETCRQRLTALQATAQPELLVEQPAEQTTHLPLLIALHGNGNNARGTMREWSRIVARGWLLAVPQSSQIVGQDAYVWDDRELATRETSEHLAKLVSAYDIDPARVILGGFSMGGGQAIWMALHQSVRASGFAVLGPYLRESELEALPELLETQKLVGVRGFILVGDEDHDCLAVSRKVVEIMQAHGLACELEVRPGLAHSYPEDFVETMSKGLALIEQI